MDECVETADICENGQCINTEGGVICECPVGYRLSDKPNSMKCIDVREEQCYDNYRRGQCTFPREGGMTKKHCCCTMGKAWGRYCEQCPPENSGRDFFFQQNLNYFYFYFFKKPTLCSRKTSDNLSSCYFLYSAKANTSI